LITFFICGIVIADLQVADPNHAKSQNDIAPLRHQVIPPILKQNAGAENGKRRSEHEGRRREKMIGRRRAMTLKMK
jgi:hypothetical protein